MRERLHPSAIQFDDQEMVTIRPDDFRFGPSMLNCLLEMVRSSIRTRIVVANERLVTEGFWTQDEAKLVLHRLRRDENGNLFDPKERTGPLRPLQYFRFIP